MVVSSTCWRYHHRNQHPWRHLPLPLVRVLPGQHAAAHGGSGCADTQVYGCGPGERFQPRGFLPNHFREILRHGHPHHAGRAHVARLEEEHRQRDCTGGGDAGCARRGGTRGIPPHRGGRWEWLPGGLVHGSLIHNAVDHG